MKRIYEEKFLEDFIRDFPEEFLGESLSLYRQQPLIGGFRPDLIFRDRNGNLVIVEIQLKALDRHHLYRMLEYRDLLMENEVCHEPRLIVFCNELPTRYIKLINTHRILCITLTKDEFIYKALQMCPELEIIEKTEPSSDTDITVSKIFKELSKPAESMREDPDALVFWLPGWFPDDYRKRDSPNYEWAMVPNLPESTELYFNDYDSYASLDVYCKHDHSELDQMPRELMIDRLSVESLSIENLSAFESWIEVITYYSILEGEDVEIILGYRGADPVYGYDDHIRNRIRKFEGLWRRYGLEKGYDFHKISTDLKLLSNFKFYANKYPLLKPIGICKTIEIIPGPGSLQDNIERKRQYIQIERSGYDITQTLKKFDSFIKSDHDEWVTINFKGVVPGALKSLKELARMIQNEVWRVKSEKMSKLLPEIGLISAKQLKNISINGLELSRKYFFHLKAPLINEPLIDSGNSCPGQSAMGGS